MVFHEAVDEVVDEVVADIAKVTRISITIRKSTTSSITNTLQASSGKIIMSSLGAIANVAGNDRAQITEGDHARGKGTAAGLDLDRGGLRALRPREGKSLISMLNKLLNLFILFLLN